MQSQMKTRKTEEWNKRDFLCSVCRSANGHEVTLVMCLPSSPYTPSVAYPCGRRIPARSR